MADATLFWCPQCNLCRHLAAPPVDERVRCVACDTFYAHAGRLFGFADWKTAADPFRMADVLTELRQEPSARKWRLLHCAIGRIEFDWCRNPWFRDALDSAEAWADSGERSGKADQCAAHFANPSNWSWRGRNSPGWAALAQRMLRNDPRPRTTDLPQWRTLAASLLRELFPNPFAPVAWNPDWLTATARDLASHIYGARDFGAMPILADALQDAGCEDKRILTHCRANTAHARGCWVLDALLGKA